MDVYNCINLYCKLSAELCRHTKNIYFFFSFINDLTYREAVENSVIYNTRLCMERRLRIPFLDTQTGIIYTTI